VDDRRRADSTRPALVAHLVNNVIVLVFARVVGTVFWTTQTRLLVACGYAALFVVATFVMVRSTSNSGGREGRASI